MSKGRVKGPGSVSKGRVEGDPRERAQGSVMGSVQVERNGGILGECPKGA